MLFTEEFKNFFLVLLFTTWPSTLNASSSAVLVAITLNVYTSCKITEIWKLWSCHHRRMFMSNPKVLCGPVRFSLLIFYKNKGSVCVEEYAYYVNKLCLKTWIWCQIVTSQTARTKYKWPPSATEWTPPHENFLRTPLVTSRRHLYYTLLDVVRGLRAIRKRTENLC